MQINVESEEERLSSNCSKFRTFEQFDSRCYSSQLSVIIEGTYMTVVTKPF